MRRLKVFIRGILEFRNGVTTHYGPELIETYDRGRELAHRLTLRKYEL